MTTKQRFEKWWKRSGTHDSAYLVAYAAYRAGFAAGRKATVPKSGSVAAETWQYWSHNNVTLWRDNGKVANCYEDMRRWGRDDITLSAKDYREIGYRRLTPAEAERRFPGSVKEKK